MRDLASATGRRSARGNHLPGPWRLRSPSTGPDHANVIRHPPQQTGFLATGTRPWHGQPHHGTNLPSWNPSRAPQSSSAAPHNFPFPRTTCGHNDIKPPLIYLATAPISSSQSSSPSGITVYWALPRPSRNTFPTYQHNMRIIQAGPHLPLISIPENSEIPRHTREPPSALSPQSQFPVPQSPASIPTSRQASEYAGV